MKPEEVRYKNLVEYDGRIFEIDTIAEEFPTLNTAEFGIGVVDWNNLKPIPLTEEWLIRFGFERKPHLIFTSLFEMDFGRKRKLLICDVDTPNQMIYLCQEDKTMENPDLICLWNYDYDGKINIHEFQNILQIFKVELTLKP